MVSILIHLCEPHLLGIDAPHAVDARQHHSLLGVCLTHDMELQRLLLELLLAVRDLFDVLLAWQSVRCRCIMALQ